MDTSLPPEAPTVDRGEKMREADEAVDSNHEVDDEDDGFDPSAPPPFRLGQIRATIPKHCWVKDTWRSLSYVVWDFSVIFSLAAAAYWLDSWVVWPLYWFAQGTMFWAIFVIGHDCGHGSFSDSFALNTLVGHLVHTIILVPYHGWRISHRTHHQNNGHVEKDEAWVPLPEKIYKNLHPIVRMLRFTVPLPLFVYPLYLWGGNLAKERSHFSPFSELFQPSERKYVITSTLAWFTMVGLLVWISTAVGTLQMLKLYGLPYMAFVIWIDFATYLQHHGYERKIPWYRGREWSYLRGALTTVDRDYGWFSDITHNVGIHVIHHIFPQIPHYHLAEATRAAKPVLGKYYREPKKSGLVPFHLIGTIVRSIRSDHYVSDEGDVVYYQTDHHLYDFSRIKPSHRPPSKSA